MIKADNKVIDEFLTHEAELKTKDERIAELTQEKSCEGCEHSKDMGAEYRVVICGFAANDDDMPFEDGMVSLKVGKNFYCKYFTPKG